MVPAISTNPQKYWFEVAPDRNVIDLTQSFSSITTKLDLVGYKFVPRTDSNEPWLQDVDSQGYAVPWHIGSYNTPNTWTGLPTIQFNHLFPDTSNSYRRDMPYFFWLTGPYNTPPDIWWIEGGIDPLVVYHPGFIHVGTLPAGNTSVNSRKIYEHIWTYPNHQVYLYQALTDDNDILL